MSALVAYDSSDGEDEDGRPPQESRNANVAQVIEVAAVESKPGPVNHPTNVPMVGPQISADMVQTYDEDDNGNVFGAPTSERDMIRYLTQATHPMTEMPPSPPGSPNDVITTRFKHFLELKAKGIHFNEDLARKSAFKNPALLSTLMERAGLDNRSAYRTSLPSSVFDASSLPADGYKEALLKNQQTIRAREEVEKKALSATGKRILEFTSGGVSSATSSPGGLQKRTKH